MPDPLVIVSGTGTAVGKTWVAAALIRELRMRGVRVVARKPVQSFERGAGLTDAQVLAAAAGEDVAVVCPPHRRYELAMAPPMAAEALGRESFTVRDLVDELNLPDDAVAIVEGAGGPRSPLATDGDTVALAQALSCDLVVLVAAAGLGTINDVLLSLPAFEPTAVVVFLNPFDRGDEVHRRNENWLRERAGVDVVTDASDLADRVTRAAPPRPRSPARRSGSVQT
jgi:dethiobiotin synthetase